MKIVSRIVFILTVGGLTLLVYNHFFPNNEKQIRKMLNGMAEAASIPAQPSPVGAVMAIDRIQSCFAPEVQVNIDVAGELHRNFSDREELMEVVKGLWGGAMRDVKVQFLDITVSVDPSKERATADLTLKATPAGQRDFFFQELKMKLKKKENRWRITNVDSVDVLRK